MPAEVDPHKQFIATQAYRLGVLDAMLHPDIKFKDSELPGLIRESLQGEQEYRCHRLDELQGIDLDPVRISYA